ncbi:MAG: rRNA maturation RNase YbeY [Desulfobacteraceae bacterium]|nr:rRNA maturation RNase YbeY [Desulfobacteraceae bacterium]
MPVLIDNQQSNQPIKTQLIQKKAQAVLSALDCPDAELSLVFVDDDRIAHLNETYLNHRGPTNVISFPMQEGDFSGINPHILGDVVISMDTCAREGKAAGLSTQLRLDQLIVHGILHLFGYDHINDEEQARVMEKKSDEMMALLKNVNS